MRLLWMLVRWPGLLQLLFVALFFLAVSALPNRNQMLIGLVVSTLGFAAWLSERYKVFAASMALRCLPDGQRILTRALAIMLLFAMSAFAAFTCWAQARGVVQLPIRSVPLALAALAGVAFLFFAQRLAAIQPRVANAFIVTLTLLFVQAIFREPSQALSWVTAGSVGALWLFVVVTAGAPSSEGWFVRVREAAQILGSPRGALGQHAPARLLLQADRLLKAALPVAFVFTLISVAMRKSLSAHAGDSLSALLGGAAGFIAVAVLFMSILAVPRARLLWLHFGNSRSQVMRECERALLVNLLLITLVVWLIVAAVAIGFDSSRMWPRLLAALPAVAVGALPALYLGLALPTLAIQWRHVPNVHILLAGILPAPLVWRAAYAVVQPMELKPDPMFVAFTVMAALLLRAFAVWRWRKIDWSYLKPEKDVKTIL